MVIIMETTTMEIIVEMETVIQTYKNRMATKMETII